jgi:flagellar biosynthesis protein FliQ
VSELEVITIGQSMIWTTLKLCLPILAAALAVGLVIALFQALTQINEQTLSFVPRILVTMTVAMLLAPWMLGILVGYTQQLFAMLPQLVR